MPFLFTKIPRRLGIPRTKEPSVHRFGDSYSRVPTWEGRSALHRVYAPSSKPSIPSFEILVQPYKYKGRGREEKKKIGFYVQKYIRIHPELSQFLLRLSSRSPIFLLPYMLGGGSEGSDIPDGQSSCRGEICRCFLHGGSILNKFLIFSLFLYRSGIFYSLLLLRFPILFVPNSY